MSEVRVIARFVANKDKEDQLRTLPQGMLIPTRAEPGCGQYELYGSDTEGRFYLHEIWESQAALDQHIETLEFRHLKQAVGELLAEPVEVTILRAIQPNATLA